MFLFYQKFSKKVNIPKHFKVIYQKIILSLQKYVLMRSAFYGEGQGEAEKKDRQHIMRQIIKELFFSHLY